MLYLCLHPWWWVATCDCTVVLCVPPVWTMGSGACPPIPRGSRSFSARGFLCWKSLVQREPPLGLAGIQGRLEGLVSIQGARQLNRHNWNFMCFLTQHCDKSFPCLFMSKLPGVPVLPLAFPRMGWVLLLVPPGAGRGLVLYSLCAFTRTSHWTGSVVRLIQKAKHCYYRHLFVPVLGTILRQHHLPDLFPAPYF